MLLRLSRARLAPYRALLAAVVVLQLVGTMAALYLPGLNADIINPPTRRDTPRMRR